MQRLKELLRLKISSNGSSEGKVNLSEAGATFDMNIVTLSQLHNEAQRLIVSEDTSQPVYTVVAMLTGIPDKLFYLSCTEEKCLKKVIWQEEVYYCQKCQKSIKEPQPWLLATFKFTDQTGS